MKCSVVIASLGREHLLETINFLNKGTVVPNEIICVFPSKTKLPKNLKKKNVKIIFCKNKNQIMQRNKGLRYVRNNYIFQIDDDVKVSKNCLKKLLIALKKLGENNTAVGPIFFDFNKKLHFDYKKESFASNIFKYLVCAAPLNEKKAGKITSIGIGYTANYYDKNHFIKSDYLPGGCVLYTKKNIVKVKSLSKNSKSYCEDILHSLARKKKNINHFVVKGAKALTEKNKKKEFIINEYLKEISVRKKICDLFDGNPVRFYTWCFLELLNRFFRSLV